MANESNWFDVTPSWYRTGSDEDSRNAIRHAVAGRARRVTIAQGLANQGARRKSDGSDRQLARVYVDLWDIPGINVSHGTMAESARVIREILEDLRPKR